MEADNKTLTLEDVGPAQEFVIVYDGGSESQIMVISRKGKKQSTCKTPKRFPDKQEAIFPNTSKVRLCGPEQPNSQPEDIQASAPSEPASFKGVNGDIFIGKAYPAGAAAYIPLREGNAESGLCFAQVIFWAKNGTQGDKSTTECTEWQAYPEALATAKLLANSKKLLAVAQKLQRRLEEQILATASGAKRNALTDENIEAMGLLREILGK